MDGEKFRLVKKNKTLIVALSSVVALTLFFAVDSLVRHKRFDPRNQLEDYIEGRVTFERVARAWGKQEETSSLTAKIEAAFSSTPEPQSGSEGTLSSGEGRQFSGEGYKSSAEEAFIARITDNLSGCKTLELDRLTFSSPSLEIRKDYVNAISDICGHRPASVTINHDARAPADMPVDSQGNKLQYVGTLIVEFARDDLPEFQMNTVTIYPKSWENPVGQTPDGACYLIPVEEVIFKT